MVMTEDNRGVAWKQTIQNERNGEDYDAIVDVISGEDYKAMLVNKVDQQQYFIDM